MSQMRGEVSNTKRHRFLFQTIPASDGTASGSVPTPWGKGPSPPPLSRKSVSGPHSGWRNAELRHPNQRSDSDEEALRLAGVLIGIYFKSTLNINI